MTPGWFARHETRWLSPYCDGVLPAPQASRVAAHVLACQRCHRELALVRTGTRLAARLVAAAGLTATQMPDWSEIGPRLDERPAVPATGWRWLPAAALVLLAVAGALHRRPVPRAPVADVPSPLEEAAVAAHDSSALEMRAGDERQVRRWISDHLGLDVSLPLDIAGRTVSGARRIGEGGVAVALALRGEPVTLAVAPAPSTRPAAGPKQISYRTIGELQVASWTRNDRRYVLASKLAGEAACSICHDPPSGRLL
jgi:anti-sigma factor RsiW